MWWYEHEWFLDIIASFLTSHEEGILLLAVGRKKKRKRADVVTWQTEMSKPLTKSMETRISGGTHWRGQCKCFCDCDAFVEYDDVLRICSPWDKNCDSCRSGFQYMAKDSRQEYWEIWKLLSKT
jgi:hypothetical protein